MSRQMGRPPVIGAQAVLVSAKIPISSANKMDAARGNVTRAEFIRQAIKEKLERTFRNETEIR